MFNFWELFWRPTNPNFYGNPMRPTFISPAPLMICFQWFSPLHILDVFLMRNIMNGQKFTAKSKWSIIITNSFLVSVPILYSLKTAESLWFSIHVVFHHSIPLRCTKQKDFHNHCDKVFDSQTWSYLTLSNFFTKYKISGIFLFIKVGSEFNFNPHKGFVNIKFPWFDAL